MVVSSNRIVLALDGDRGLSYAQQSAELLDRLELDIHLIASETFINSIEEHSNLDLQSIQSICSTQYRNDNIGAPMASGSWQNLGMLIAPCSMSMVSHIANGITGTLISRSADVALKERRPVVVMPLESPYHLTDLDNMKKFTTTGGIVVPPLSDQSEQANVKQGLQFFNIPQNGENDSLGP